MTEKDLKSGGSNSKKGNECKETDKSQNIKNDNVKSCKDKCSENNNEMIEKDIYMRLLADFKNYKTRTEINQKNLSTFTEQLIFAEVIAIVDEFERFLSEETDADKKTVVGLSLILKKINSLLNKFGVKKIEIKEGDLFNDELAESVSIQEVTDKNLEHKIVKIYENGYKIKDKVLRFAKVVVGKLKE